MCGRYTLFTPQSELADRFGVTFERPLEPRYNCAPGQDLPVITSDVPDVATVQTWGLRPAWADDTTAHINARAETVDEKSSFRESFEARRCLVPADGFYEWTDAGGERRPHRVAFADDRPFAMAGIWARWEPPETQTGLDDFGGGTADAGTDVRESFAVVTTEPNDVVEPLHHRMAVVLAPEEEETWLDGDPEAARALLDTHPGDEMHSYPVSTRVNSPTNDDPDLIDPVEA
jgi:putative SOS response-associated peptidase YedK